MLNTIEFQGLKFKTSFNFNSRKQRHTYFNDLLVKSTYNFQEKQKEYFSEKLHVVFSYYMSFKVAAYIILGLALISPSFKVAIAVAAIVTFLTSLMLNRKFQFPCTEFNILA